MLTINGSIFFPTHTGKRISLDDLDQSQICIEDIALGLASNARWGGQTDVEQDTITGAEHSVRMSHLVPIRVAPLALLHDAPEYVMCDIPRPVKGLIGGYEKMEETFLFQILKKFGIQNLLYTPEASWMWELDRVFPLVEVGFSGLFASADNYSKLNGEDNPKTKDWVRLLGEQTMGDYPLWGWPRKLAYERFLMRARQLGVHVPGK